MTHLEQNPNLVHLTPVLNLGANSLTGDMPVTLGTMSNLVTLDLSSNLLEGSIKESHFVKLLKLKELCLSWTNLFLGE
ncbi:hypothetical protein JHK82_042544 [Glycine max]|nr:hypothetical protein JHK82_042544 [Glycine max]